MDVLHHAFSLSACPKCHLLICKHTSLANLDFHTIEKDEQHASINLPHPYQRLSTHGMNFYLLPSTIVNNRYSWTTFGSQSMGSIETLKNEEDIPFADENIISMSLPLKPTMTHIVRTQSERYPKHVSPEFYLTKSFSFSTINTSTTPKSIISSVSSPRIEQDDHRRQKCPWNVSLFILMFLVLSYLMTNTLDIVLLYVYYHINSLTFILFTCVLLACDLILWINNLLNYRNLPTRLLLIPFILRFYLLYELVEYMISLFNKNSMIDSEMSDSSSSPSSSTTTTLETNLSRTTKVPLIPSSSHHHLKTIKRRLYQTLLIFSLTHSSLIAFVNLYFWSNNFQLTVNSSLTMDYILPYWIHDEHQSTSIELISPQPTSLQ